MNGYEMHGIGYLSASKLNMAAASMPMFLMQNLLRFRQPTNAQMARGKAAEEGINAGLLDHALPVEACVEKAVAAFDAEMRLNSDDKRESERNHLAGYVENGLAELRLYGVPTSYQERIEVQLPDVPIPVMGFIDWAFSQHGMIVDLKTTERLPSSISTAHARQGAIYAAAHNNYGMRFAYVKPRAGKSDGRSCVVLELDRDTINAELKAITNIAIRLERFLRLSKDPQELLGLVIPDFDSFYFSNPQTRARAAEAFGF